MKQVGSMAMGPTNAFQTLEGEGAWSEVVLPYIENRNEEEVELDPDYWGPMPSWEIWDWLEENIPDLHDDVNGSAAWWRTRKQFTFFFRDPKKAIAFSVRFQSSTWRP